MSDLKISISKTILNEGGYVDNPADPGGATKYGVTQRDITGLPGFPVNVADLTTDQATDYYLQYYWKKFGEKGVAASIFYPQISNQAMLDKIFDMSVLFGIAEIVMLIQHILLLTEDGFFGAQTLDKVNESDPVSFLNVLKTVIVSHAIGIANAKPSEREFLAGWIRRVNL